MDGTGSLFKPLLELLPRTVDSQVICLNNLRTHTIEAQVIELGAMIGHDETIILCESYSGYLCFKLSLLKNLNIKHIIYAASFLENPSWLSRFYKILSLGLVRCGAIPNILLSTLLFGQFKSNSLVKAFLQSLRAVDDHTLRRRLHYIANLKRPTEHSLVASTYVQASHDCLVSKKSIDAFNNQCNELTIMKAKGGHFLVQSNPEFFARLIQRLIKDTLSEI